MPQLNIYIVHIIKGNANKQTGYIILKKTTNSMQSIACKKRYPSLEFVYAACNLRFYNNY